MYMYVCIYIKGPSSQSSRRKSFIDINRENCSNVNKMRSVSARRKVNTSLNGPQQQQPMTSPLYMKKTESSKTKRLSYISPLSPQATSSQNGTLD